MSESSSKAQEKEGTPPRITYSQKKIQIKNNRPNQLRIAKVRQQMNRSSIIRVRQSDRHLSNSNTYLYKCIYFFALHVYINIYTRG